MKLSLIALIAIFSFSTFAAPKTKIATCSIPATADEPAGKVVVTFKGGSVTAAKNFLVSYNQGEINKTVPADVVTLSADKSVLGIVFMRFITLKINDGQTSDSTMGVMLGAPAQEIECSADFSRL